MNDGTIPTIDGKSFEIIKVRSLKEVRKVPVRRIVIYECPHEMLDRDVLTELPTYGILRDKFVEWHKFKETEIYNGVRTMTHKGYPHNPIYQWK